VTGCDQEMTKSTVFATAQLREGGEQNYTISLVRDGLSWKVVNVETTYLSQDGQTPMVTTAGVVPTEVENESTEGEAAAESEAEGSAEGEGGVN
jgi:hypothetical protein